MLAATCVCCVVYACITTDTPKYCVKEEWTSGPTTICTYPADPYDCIVGTETFPDCLVDQIKDGALYSGKDNYTSTPVECYYGVRVHSCDLCFPLVDIIPGGPNQTFTNTCNALTPSGNDCPPPAG